ncbi:hypothetical protein M2317_001774 [Microbacterium sp. ZKA21]|uniref:DUF4832 domain-containing protein n=1 Tax=Microbacterium sp. ZKA21 TaxID=3381694 RepID=UPI003D1B3A50
MGTPSEYGRRTVLGMGVVGALAATSALILPSSASAATAAASGTASEPRTASGLSESAGRSRTATFAHDAGRVLRNPLNGFVLYSTATVADDYWEHYDNMVVPGLDGPVRVSDYAPTLYMRLSWAVLNPAEGVYGWDTDEKLKWMLQNARDRDMRLAFRVVVDSRDKPLGFTPDYVRAAGAQGYESTSGTKVLWSPYPDDPIFQRKYEAFLTAFAARFGDPEEMDFIDGYGLGKWGEGHSMKYLDIANRDAVWKWNIDLYSRLFPTVPLAVNYHRMIGGEKDWGTADPNSRALLDYAYQDKGWILRQDAFGMTTYYGQWEREVAGAYLYKRPIILEGGWVTHSHSYSDDPRGYETPGDVRQGEYDDGQQAHVNSMDFRVGETESWFEDRFDLVQAFNEKGGYRLHPGAVTVPAKVAPGGQVAIQHSWVNQGWGFLPNDIPAWNHKYRVAFALLDNAGKAVDVRVDAAVEPATWRSHRSYEYTTTATIGAVPKGHYRWALAIVDTTTGSTPAIELATSSTTTADGWLVIADCTVA